MLSVPMPTCAEVRRELEAMAMNELRGRDRELVRNHIARCQPCARAAHEVAGIVYRLTGLRAPAGRPTWRRLAVPIAIAAGIVLAFTLDLRPKNVDRRGAPEERVYAISGMQELIKAQASDGAWRESSDDRSFPHTVGLSGLAAVGCLRAGDSSSTTAGQLGCDFLAKALARAPLRDSDAAPDLRLRAQAAATWALAVAAERWPDRYQLVAARAVRDLVQLEDTWARPDGGLVLDDMTRLLLTSAHQEAAALRAGSRADSESAAPARLAVRLLSDSEKTDGTAPLTRLASRVLAGALPRSGSATF